MIRRALLMAPLALSGMLTGCDMPRFEGPQIQSPPLGFLVQNETFLQRRLFPDRDLAAHMAWVHTEISGVSVIYLNAHPGQLTLDDVVAAQEAARAAATDPDRRFGSLEPLTIDGREAWGWEERVESTRRGLVDVAYRAVIPYDTVTWAIEFESGEPIFKTASPDTLRTIVSSFAYGRVEWNVPLIAMGVGVGLLLLSGMRGRAKQKSQRLRSINLVQVKKPEDEEGAVPEAPGPPATPHATPPQATPAPTAPPPGTVPPAGPAATPTPRAPTDDSTPP